jgi:hypothetical protein
MMALSVQELRYKAAGVVTETSIYGTVSQLQALRPREYLAGVVLNFTLTDSNGHAIRAFFYDDWARAVSFVCDGDGFQVSGSLTLRLAPEHKPFDSACAAALLAHPDREIHLTPNGDSVVTIEQQAELGDVLQLRVTAANFENPEASVKRKPTQALVLANDNVDTGRVLPVSGE